MDTVKVTIPETESFDDAYTKVEHYLVALQIKNRRVLSKLVYLILENTAKKHSLNPEKNITTLAMQEAHRLTSEWCEKILGVKFTHNVGIPAQGKLAMLLSDIPNKWVKYFLSEGTVPQDLVDSMRKTYLSSGPDFQIKRMTHRALELNPAGSILAETFKFVNKIPYGKLVIYLIIIALFIFLFYLTR